MAMPPTITTRDGLREAIRFDLSEALEEKLQPVDLKEGDVWNGVRVLTAKDLKEALAGIFDEPLPPPSETTVEVSTPATIIVTAECPRCFIASELTMTVGPELRVNADGSEIRLRAKAKARTHVCGQLPLTVAPVSDVVDGQEELDLGEDDETTAGPRESAGTGEPMEAIEVAADGTEAVLDVKAVDDVCPFPGCQRGIEHRGPHKIAVPFSSAPGDDDLLPA